jgi:signal transduction histidine kinase
LSQPLTVLRCSLALSLKGIRTRAYRRQDLQIALQQVESVAWLASRIRELVEAGNHDAGCEGSDMADCLNELVSEWTPVAESAGVKLLLVASPCYVPIVAGRLRQALVLLLDLILASARAGSEISITAGGQDKEARLSIQTDVGKSPAGKLSRSHLPTRKTNAFQQRVGLAIARRIFESSSGRVRISHTPRRLSITIDLPRAAREPALPLGRSFRRPA